MTGQIYKKLSAAATLLAASILTPTAANAITYGLNINNVYTTDLSKAYVTVTIEDGIGSHTGDIKFTIDANESLFDTANFSWLNTFTNTTINETFNNFGIQSVGFNRDIGLDYATFGIEFLNPAGWGFNDSGGGQNAQDGFGRFDVVASDGGQNRQDPLVFWITGVTGDSIDSYALAPSSTSQNPTDKWFAVHVTDINTGVYGWLDTIQGDPCIQGGADCEYQLLSSAYFTHDGTSPTVVPVPAAVWLFGSGLIGLVAVARRRKMTA